MESKDKDLTREELQELYLEKTKAIERHSEKLRKELDNLEQISIKALEHGLIEKWEYESRFYKKVERKKNGNN